MPHQIPTAAKLTFCEGVHATGNSPWHLRWRLGEKKLGGGIDSDSMCGRVKAPEGWDLESETDRTGIDHDFVCKQCREEYGNFVRA